MKKTKIKVSGQFYTRLYLLLAVALIIIMTSNLFQISASAKVLNDRITETKEALRPADIKIITIKDSDCRTCFDVSAIVDSVKNSNVNIISEENLEVDQSKSQDLILQYGIEKLPTVIVQGEIDKISVSTLQKEGDILIFRDLVPPYIKATNKEIVGKVSAIVLTDSSCKECTDFESTISALEELGVVIISKVDLGKDENLIDKYSIEVLPTLILSKEIREYNPDILAELKNVGTFEDDGSYVLRQLNPPYINLTDGKLKGLVSATYLRDETCSDCYSGVEFHMPILQSMGVFLEENNVVNASSSEGQDLIEKYSIEKLPTLILEGDIESYPYLISAWKGVGSVESDGSYVFRKVEIANQPYLDLNTKKVVAGGEDL